MAALDDLKAFDLANADISLWVFKGPTGLADAPPTYSGHWVSTTDAVDAALKETIEAERVRIEEVAEYGLLAQNNEASALSLSTVETNAGLIVDQVAAETQAKKVGSVKQIRNAKFYVVKLVHGETVIHAVRKTDSGWRTKNAFSTHSLFYIDSVLTIDDRPRFDIAKNVDFFIVADEVLMVNKGRCESVLRYKQAHKDDFVALSAEVEFLSVFVDLAPLTVHVGDNKIQLRRASAIRQKGHYKDAAFMGRLRQLSAQYGFTFQFDAAGKIIVTPETCAQIITALLDHRLASAFSTMIYDVPSTTQIVVQ